MVYCGVTDLGVSTLSFPFIQPAVNSLEDFGTVKPRIQFLGVVRPKFKIAHELNVPALCGSTNHCPTCIIVE
jgi:hypothetical protein